ncbi:glycoside hydrolase family 113 [Mucisphaera sp.]|uniref:glycoside hydrolase family 113 n=1 Tax=Mucisphaera sp. TaxID=2913024 RepID=UPI003D0CBD23
MAIFAAGSSAHANLTFQPGHDPKLGFNAVSWWNFGNGSELWETEIQQMFDHGFREVSISPVRYVTPGVGVIPQSSQRGPELSHIAAGITRAKSLGMTVTVNPFVEVENFQYWRGFYDPAPGSNEAQTFWSDYTNYVIDVATLSESLGVEALTIGTELKTLSRNTGHNPNWTALIDAVDTVFTGDIGYAANWDNYDHPNVAATIWDHPAIDFIGVDAYFRIVSPQEADNSSSAGFEDLVENRWNSLIDNAILPFANARQAGTGLPVKFTEYGATPLNRGIAIASNGTNPDVDEQLKGFRGLLKALDGRADDINAVHVWQWGMPGTTGSEFHIDPTLQTNLSGGFDESLNTALGQMLSDFVSSPAIPGDFNTDGLLTAADIDLLTNSTTDPAFDLTGDGIVDATDLTTLVEELIGTAFGDANLDGNVDLIDLSTLAVHFGGPGGWADGDFSGNGAIELSDLSRLATSFGFSATSVPEPTVGLLILTALIKPSRNREQRTTT